MPAGEAGIDGSNASRAGPKVCNAGLRRAADRSHAQILQAVPAVIERLQVEVRMRLGFECFDHLLNLGPGVEVRMGSEWAAGRVAAFYRGLPVRIERVRWRRATDWPGYVSRSEWVTAEWPAGSNRV